MRMNFFVPSARVISTPPPMQSGWPFSDIW